MFLNSRVNGFLLLMTFGLLCGVISGALVGIGIALYFGSSSHYGEIVRLIFVFSGIGAAFGALPGIAFGLSSYYFKTTADWFLTGSLFGAGTGGVLMFPFGWRGWPFLIICAAYGLLISMLNVRFSSWWGMQLREEGMELLTKKS